MYVYQEFKKGVYTVGFYALNFQWFKESAHNSREIAAARVHYLNGGVSYQQISMIVDQLASWLSDISASVKDLKTVGQND